MRKLHKVLLTKAASVEIYCTSHCMVLLLMLPQNGVHSAILYLLNSSKVSVNRPNSNRSQMAPRAFSRLADRFNIVTYIMSQMYLSQSLPIFALPRHWLSEPWLVRWYFATPRSKWFEVVSFDGHY
jgi:hypothetical protein